MLGSSPLIAFVAATDAPRTRRFYRDVLGLDLISENPFALEFDCDGTMLRVTLASEVHPAPYTVLGWRVDNIDAAVERLAAAGVGTELFEGFDQSQRGVWTAPGGARVAWFRDPDGNLLSVTQFEEAASQ